MIDNIYLVDYNISYKDTIIKMIRDFFSFHSTLIETNKELTEEGYVQATETLTDWLPNYLKIIMFNEENIGFVRIAQRGGTVAWLEDHMIGEEIIKDWTLNIEPNKIIKIPRTGDRVSKGPRIIYFWKF